MTQYIEVKPALTNEQMYDAIIEGLSVTAQKLTNDLSTARNEVKRLERVRANEEQITREAVDCLKQLLVDEDVDKSLAQKIANIFGFEMKRRVLVSGTVEFSFETDVSLYEDDYDIIQNLDLSADISSCTNNLYRLDTDIENSSINIEDV
jgi:signal transduction protein with GAF and PtsI domain